jgi:3-methyladenine DNA glycosylase AlkC
VTPKNVEHSDRPRLWKDRLDEPLLRSFASQVKKACPDFRTGPYIKAVLSDGYLRRELKDRMNLMSAHLRPYLPSDYTEAVAVLIKVAPHVGGWENWALTSFVEQFGLEEFEISVAALKELTPFGTAESAVRPFVNHNPTRMLEIMSDWAESDNEHVRRLAAEGSRPRGVWVAHTEAFKKNPRPVLKLLEKLKADPSDYVRRAVANNLNDISKDHPDLVIQTALHWKKRGNAHTDWIVKHACRYMIKAGHPEVFPVFGFAYPPKVSVKQLKVVSENVRIGGDLSFSFDVRSQTSEEQRLAVDYAVHYVRPNGSSSAKVFKLCERTVPARSSMVLSGSRSFENRSTRKHYPGRHRIDVLVNGVCKATAEFPVIK